MIYIIFKKIGYIGSAFSKFKNKAQKICKKKIKNVDIVFNVQIERMEELDEIKRFLEGLN